MSRCYRHIAPLERKAPTICGAASIVGARFPRPTGWGSQRLRVQGCATIPHCAPLERGGWTCRAAIDISLLWSERHRCTKICGAASIVGARFPRPTGWGSQRLRVQGCATIPHCAPLECGDWRCRAAIDISLLWSERRHNLRCGIHRRGEVASPDGLGQPTPTGSTVCDNTTLRSSGARGLDVSRCYRHIAPLERKAPMHQNSRAASIVGAGFPRPAGWGTQPLRIPRSRFPCVVASLR